MGLGPWLHCVTSVHITAALKPAGHDRLQTQQIAICLHHQAVAVNPTSFTGNPGVTNQLSLLCTRHTAINHKIIVFTRAVDLKLPDPANSRNARLLDQEKYICKQIKLCAPGSRDVSEPWTYNVYISTNEKRYFIFLTGWYIQELSSEEQFATWSLKPAMAAASSMGTGRQQVGDADETSILLGVWSLYFIHAICEME